MWNQLHWRFKTVPRPMDATRPTKILQPSPLPQGQGATCSHPRARPVDLPAALPSRPARHPLLIRRLSWATTQATQQDLGLNTRWRRGHRVRQPLASANSSMNTTALITCRLAVLARILDGSLGTLRLVAVIKGRRAFAPALGFVKAVVYVCVVAKGAADSGLRPTQPLIGPTVAPQADPPALDRSDADVVDRLIQERGREGHVTCESSLGFQLTRV